MTHRDQVLSAAQWDSTLLSLIPVARESSDNPSVRFLDSSRLFRRYHSVSHGLHRIGEALNVLSLISGVDPAAWRRELQRLWPAHADVWGEDSMFEIGIVFRVYDFDDLLPLGERVLDLDRLSYDYCCARERIMSLHARDSQERVGTITGGLSRPRIPVRLVFAFAETIDLDVEVTSRILEQTLLITTSQQRFCSSPSDNSDDSWLADRARFEIAYVEFDARLEIDEMGLSFLSELVELGVMVDNIPSLLLDCNFFNGCDALSLTETLQHLVAGMGCDPSEAFQGVKRLTINDTSFSVYFIPIMTAAQVSKSLRTVQVHIAEDQLDEHVLDLWRCLAYTLLSSDADHNITRLELELNHFRVEYVNAIRAVLEASRPALPTIAGADVFDRLLLLPAVDHPSSLLEQPSQRLTCSKVFLFDPRCDNRAEYAINEFAATDLRVIHDENTDDYTRTVLLPGWGKGWVQDQREAVSTEEEPLSTQSHAQNTRSFRELSILDINEASMPAATTLMSLIGSQVELLEIEAWDDGTAFDAWLVAVLPHFPSLHRLKIKRGRIINPGTLMDVLGTAERGIQSLMLNCDISNFSTEEVSRFFYALEDRHHPVSSAFILQLRACLLGLPRS